eukprot:TRINITY_DN1649_c0_g2_i5.p1 TRINITY_DN1649_c0_g2~~TRINITY_DN1649_c0_g2_i5.p1  ORF type:complete len:670 (+),score=77.33 TRINITY_DN1649_c0_g2_i5:102-2111(+)
MEKRGGAVDWKTGMGDLDVDDHLPAHLADHQGAEESPAARTSPQVPWLLNSKRPAITRARCCAAIGVPIGVVFVVAIVTGLSINHVYTGDAWNGGRGQVPFPDPDNLDVQGSTEITLNALVQGSVCAAVASGMALVRFGFRNYTHPRVYGVFSFVSYVILLLVLLYQVYDGTDVTVLTNSQANAFANQIYNFLGGTFNWEDAKFATTFRDIVQVSDFWAFMRGPFHDFLLGSALNRLSASDSAERTTRIPINAPAMTNVQFNAVNDHNTRLGMVPWIVSYCNMRQVVRQPEVIDVPSLLGTQIGVEAFTGEFVEEQAQVSPVLSQLYASQNFSVHALPRSFTNAFGQSVDAWDVVGTTRIGYPGAGGLVLTDTTYPKCYTFNATIYSVDYVEGSHGCIYRGSWIAEWAGYNGTQFEQIYEREIQTLSTGVGVDADTVLVQLGCNVLNTLEKIQAYTFYTVELMPSGQVVPMEPTVILAQYPFTSQDDVWFPLILGFYILCEELQDVIVGGWKDYFLHAGWLNLFDWMTVFMLFMLWVFGAIYQGVIPELNIPWQMRTDTFWTLALVQSYWQTLLGLACFCMVTKGLKYTKNVPIMCGIGNTFSHAMVPVGVLLLVIFFLLFGFAIVFQIKFSTTQMNSFNSLGTSLFSVFRGLMGEIVLIHHNVMHDGQ